MYAQSGVFGAAPVPSDAPWTHHDHEPVVADERRVVASASSRLKPSHILHMARRCAEVRHSSPDRDEAVRFSAVDIERSTAVRPRAAQRDPARRAAPTVTPALAGHVQRRRRRRRRRSARARPRSRPRTSGATPRVSLCVHRRRLLRELDPDRRAPPRSCRCPTRWSASSTTTARCAVSTPTGTTTAPPWSATSASCCAFPSSARARTSPGDLRRSACWSADRTRGGSVVAVSGRHRARRRRRGARGRSRQPVRRRRAEAASPSGGADRWWRGRSTPRSRPGCSRCCSSTGHRARLGARRAAPAGRRRRATARDWQQGHRASLRAALDALDGPRRGRRRLRRAGRPAPRRRRGLPPPRGRLRRRRAARGRRPTTAPGATRSCSRVASGPRPASSTATSAPGR